MIHSDVQLFTAGRWRNGGGERLPIFNPATEEQIGWLANASPEDLDQALEAAAKGFSVWRAVPAMERGKLLRKVADLLRARGDEIAPVLTREQGKPLAQARQECINAADIFDWFAEETRRIYGRTIPARSAGVQQIVGKEPVGPVAAFTPWNFPIAQVSRKVAAALAAGCSIIVKAAEDTPGSTACLMRVIEEAGIPAGVVNLVFGVPLDISSYLIPHPVIRKVSFTGSTAVGKLLAELAGKHMKRITMELGGHAPAIVFDDADVKKASSLLVAAKFRNAGQVCISPTRFLVQEGVYEEFLDRFVDGAKAIVVGDGMQETTTMGPLVNRRRVNAIEQLVADAVGSGSEIRVGGKRAANKGCFFEATVLTGVSKETQIMNEEPFGPVAIVTPFRIVEEALEEANRLPYGLAAYAYTKSSRRASLVSDGVEAGMISINHQGIGPIETPFGGVKESGYGSEGGTEAVEGYLVTKFVSHHSDGY